MDEVTKRFTRELAQAVAAAVARDPEVEAARARARAAGLDMKVRVEAVHAVHAAQFAHHGNGDGARIVAAQAKEPVQARAQDRPRGGPAPSLDGLSTTTVDETGFVSLLDISSGVY